MNLIVEVIDGVAYAVEKADNCLKTCVKCFFAVRNCDAWCVRGHDITHAYYRRLTTKEREELHKAIEKGKNDDTKTR